MENTLSLLFTGLGIYLLLGFLFAIIVQFKGLNQIDPATKGSGWGFKLLILPGLTVFWILFLIKWIKSSANES